MSTVRWFLASFTAALFLSAAPAAHADPSLVAAYGFEEASGTTATDSAGSNPGTLAGPTRSPAGRFGAALSFDGVDDRVNVGDSNALDLTTGMTLEAWVKPDRVDDWRTVILKERPSQLAYALYASTDDGKPMSEINAASAQRDAHSATALAAGTWSHLAATYDAATLRIYINGTQVGSRATTGLIGVSTGALRIGGNAIWGEPFAGLIDEVRIYNRALTATELTTDMNTPVVNAGPAPDTEPPTAPTVTAELRNGDDVYLTWGSASDNVGVTQYRIYREGTLLTTRTAAGSYTDLNRPAGTVHYSVVAVDAAGNTSPAGTAEATIEADTTPPTVSIAGDCSGTLLAHDTIEVFPQVSDERSSISKVTVQVDGATIFETTDGTSHFLWNTRNVSNGVHTMRAIARDAAGNEGTSAECAFNVFNPQITTAITAPAAGSTVGGDVKVHAEVLGDGQPLPRDGWYGGGTPVQSVTFNLPTGNVTDTTYPYEVTWTTTNGMPGGKTLKATAGLNAPWPNANPIVSPTVSVTVNNTPPADTTPPTVSLNAACNNTTVKDYITLRPTFNDDSGSVSLTVKVDGTTIYSTGLGTGGSPLFDWETRNFSNGTRVMTATARDAAGNETTTPPCEWNVQNGVYTVPFTAPADGDVVSGKVTLRAAPTGSDFVVFEAAGGAFGPDNIAPFEVTWDTTKVANGPYTLKASAWTLGYSQANATSTISVRVANVVPKPVLNASVTSGDDVQLSWAAPPADAGVTGYKLLRDGTQIATPAGSATAYTDADRAAGTYSYTLVAVNGGGVASAASDAASATVSPPAVPTGLVAAYGFETASGSVAADSAGTNNGTISGATSVTGGKFGRALSFDGVNDLVTVPDANPLDLAPGMTLEAWVKPDTVADWRTVVFKERPGQLAYALYAAADNGRPQTEIAASGQKEARGTAALSAGQWTHVAATYDKAALKLYVNGVQVASTPATATLFNSAGALRIGGNTIWGEWFSGLIDEVRIYERALSAAEVSTDMNRAVAP